MLFRSEIHMGEIYLVNGKETEETLTNERKAIETVVMQGQGGNGNIYGSYIHGLFDCGDIARTIVRCLAQKKGLEIEVGGFTDYRSFKETQYDKLAYTLRKYMDMEAVYGMLREACLG